MESLAESGDTNRWQEASAYVDALRDSTGDGICIAMAQIDGTEVNQHFAGNCDSQNLFQIGSITKTFTGVLLADAVLDGRVALSTPVSELLDGSMPAVNGRPMTLLDLSTHASGLPRLPSNLVLDGTTMADPYLNYGGKELLEFLAMHELSRAPEAQVEYSNVGVGLLGYLLADMADTSYGHLVKATITGPLGMKDTVVEPNSDQLQRATAAHTSAGDEVPRWGFDSLAGAGALYSTLDDMLVYIQANLTAPDGVIGDRLALAAEPKRTADPLGGEIGLGWINQTENGNRGVWHNGGTAGHRSFAGFLPDSGRGVIVLASASLNEVDAIGGFLLGASVTLPVIADSEDGPYAEYLGKFNFTASFAIQTTSDGETLFGQATGQPRFTLTEGEQDRFRVQGVDAEIRFNRSENGSVISITLFQNGAEQLAKKDDNPKEQETVAREVVVVAANVLESYVGRYQLAPGMVLSVTVDAAQLYVQLTGQPAFPVYPTSETRFYYEVVEAEVGFNLSESGEVTSMTLFQNGQHQARRLDD